MANLSSSRGREELAEATGSTYQMDVILERCFFLREARDDPGLHDLNFNLRHCDLLVPHTEGQCAGGHVKRYAGFRNLGNACFIIATLHVFLNVGHLRSQIRNPLFPIVVNAGNVGVATEKLNRVQQALKGVELRYASNKWSVIVPIFVLQSVFGRHRMLCNDRWPARRCYGLFLHLLRQCRLFTRTTVLDTYTRADVAIS